MFQECTKNILKNAAEPHKHEIRDMMCVRHWEDWKNGEVLAVGTGHIDQVAVEREKQP